MLARSGKVSMATKKRSGEEINDRQILCGMGIKLRRLTAGNGVTIQTQTTVKVTGNSSTAHVASFIADPSTIAATNTDLSTLKATVEDGSGNLIEGLTVYFALKSGSATLTSLTAVTDQNGIATTSVKGAMTGSVTVSAVTTAGGMQTVDITLVAGPADTSQSVLKSNRSSLKGDYTDSAELRLVL